MSEVIYIAVYMRCNHLPNWVSKFIVFIVPTIFLLLGAIEIRAQEPRKQLIWPSKTWQIVKSPETVGWSSEKLAAAKAYGDSIHTSAVMIVQGGEVVDQWGDFEKKLTSYSVRKSLISALYGIYSAEGIIDVNETLEHLGIDDSPDPLTKEEKKARIVDILRARSGVYHPVDFESPAQKKLRPARGSHAPGTFWFYNNWDFNVLGTIFEKKTGKKIGEAFYERIAKPIGMHDFMPDDVFYLEAWVEKSSHANEMVQFGEVDAGGYEYLWWVEYGGKHFPEASLPGMYSARGAGGHYVLIVPSLDLVIIHRVDNDAPAKDVGSVLDQGLRPLVTNATFGHLVSLILAARTP